MQGISQAGRDHPYNYQLPDRPEDHVFRQRIAVQVLRGQQTAGDILGQVERRSLSYRDHLAGDFKTD